MTENKQSILSIKLLSIREVQAALGVSLPTVNRLIKSKSLKTINIGRAVRIPEQAVLDFLNRGGERHI